MTWCHFLMVWQHFYLMFVLEGKIVAAIVINYPAYLSSAVSLTYLPVAFSCIEKCYFVNHMLRIEC